MATAAEIRIYSGKYAAEGVSFPRNDFMGVDYTVCDRMECNHGRRVEATWSPPGPVVFGKWPRKWVMPFADRRYETFDELADDMRAEGLSVIDLRKVIGVVKSVEQFQWLMETHSLERLGYETIFIRRNPDGTHDDIWQLTERAFNALRRKLIVIGTNNKRKVLVRGRTPFSELADWQKDAVTRAFQPIQPLRPAPGTTEADVVPAPQPAPPIIALPGRAEQWAKTARVEVSPIFAYDDQGKPITELDLVRESTRKVPQGMPKSLLPEVSENCSDERWEKLMLAEQIRFRRRSSAS